MPEERGLDAVRGGVLIRDDAEHAPRAERSQQAETVLGVLRHDFDVHPGIAMEQISLNPRVVHRTRHGDELLAKGDDVPGELPVAEMPRDEDDALSRIVQHCRRRGWDGHLDMALQRVRRDEAHRGERLDADHAEALERGLRDPAGLERVRGDPGLEHVGHGGLAAPLQQRPGELADRATERETRTRRNRIQKPDCEPQRDVFEEVACRGAGHRETVRQARA